MMRLALHWQILIAILLAAVAGTLTGTEASLFGVSFYATYQFIGTLFLNALKMLMNVQLSSQKMGKIDLGNGTFRRKK